MLECDHRENGLELAYLEGKRYPSAPKENWVSKENGKSKIIEN